MVGHFLRGQGVCVMEWIPPVAIFRLLCCGWSLSGSALLARPVDWVMQWPLATRNTRLVVVEQ